MSGKGSARRPSSVSGATFAANWRRAFEREGEYLSAYAAKRLSAAIEATITQRAETSADAQNTTQNPIFGGLPRCIVCFTRVEDGWGDNPRLAIERSALVGAINPV